MRLLTVLARVLSWPIVLSLVAAACGGGGTTAPTGGATAAPTTAALNWPTQPITLIVPFAAGGDTHVPMRLGPGVLGKGLGQAVVVQNVGGAGGSTGTRQGKSGRPAG